MKSGHSHPPGLRQRLLLWILLPLIVVFTGSILFDYRLAQETANTAYDHSLNDAALDITAYVQTTGLNPELRLTPEAEAMLRSDAMDKIFFAIHGSDQQLLAGDADLPIYPGSLHERPTFVDDIYQDEEIRATTHRIVINGDEITITVAETMRERNHASHRILAAIAFPNLMIIVATLLVIYFGVRRGLAPLVHIENQIASRSPRDLRALDIEHAPREIRPMLTRLNELFESLRLAAAAQQRFLADAAHQLRTPLAGLQTQIELVAAEGKYLRNEERLARIEESVERIAHLVTQLLIYAQTESAASANQVFQPVALHELAESSASIFIDRALLKDIDLGFEIEPAVTEGIAWMLREALGNLIDNALRYCPSGSTITVRSGIRFGRSYLAVEDNGPGISVTERDKVFERFYRIPGSASGGCGLGLSIVQEIAQLHTATINFSEPAGGGLTVILTFPASNMKNE
ncbi:MULTISPECIES: sensor histidine kinase [Nitrosomonas]|uniref:histidine kinase n=2 Tax=Nitrosomonas eutropha TaxID=916 RepID=A0ABX5MA80_9PROT|nr:MULTISPECIES: sensor histidine kinase [Nitrosomonas]ABI59809.1 periplasmic sensor signal transduction histidine kinase [Nitrosomonas eutropha C91]MXS80307.1 sensor histidine kinase [Nitrosomonas sp. GH22]PXV83600.1 two-component system sensor histidine kinase TctE [Nitrosomonas eutropha]SCW99940.1 two-component system, OmpR family, sensor histidine kinase TctE [Nitrosomonas eutropha]SDW31218.1 two-component system, OmpR family, sensor histidine kinase TctE [Nitrosomonas eutropha]